MKKRISSLALSALLAASVVPTMAHAAPAAETVTPIEISDSISLGVHSLDTMPTVSAMAVSFDYAASALNQLGMFKGTASGYELYRAPTRQEMVVMLIRLLGEEAMVTAQTWSHPFTDVDAWASPYIGYAYTQGYVSGISDRTFGAQEYTTAPQYITVMLRLLGYSDSQGDFQWNIPWTLSDRIGLTEGQYNAGSAFVRGDMALLSYNTLRCNVKEDSWTLFQWLKSYGSIPAGTKMPMEAAQAGISVNPTTIDIPVGQSKDITFYYDDANTKIVFSLNKEGNGIALAKVGEQPVLRVTGNQRGTYQVFLYYDSTAEMHRYTLAVFTVTVY